MLARALLIPLSIGALVAIGGCSGSNDDDDVDPWTTNDQASADPSPADNDPSDDSADDAPELSVAAINADNHVAVLAAVFDAVAGTPHDEIRARLDEFVLSSAPSHDSGTDSESFLRTLQYECDGGGSATRDRFEPRWQLETDSPRAPVVGDWSFAECVTAAGRIEGSIDVLEARGEVVPERLRSPGLDIEGDDGDRLRFNGVLYRSVPAPDATQPRFRIGASGVSFERHDADGEHRVLDLDSELTHGFLVGDGPRTSQTARLEAHLVLISPLAGGQAITVDTPEPLEYSASVPYAASSGEWHFTSGRLGLQADDGSGLMLEADSGDLPTPATSGTHARVTLTDPAGEKTVLIEPWSLWQENLRYATTQHPWTPPALEPDSRPDGSSVIDVNDALTLLDEVFALFVARELGSRLLAVGSPFDLSTTVVESRMIDQPDFPSSVLQYFECEGGGSLSGLLYIPIGTGDVSDAQWTYDDCVSGATRYNGEVGTLFNRVTSVTSEALLVENPSEDWRLMFSGTLVFHPSLSRQPYSIRRLRAATLRHDSASGVRVVEASDTSYGEGSYGSRVLWSAHLAGRFVLRSPRTGGLAVRVETLEDFVAEVPHIDGEDGTLGDPITERWSFASGRLAIVAGDGSKLIADAAAADPGRLLISVTDNAGTTVEFDEDWARWRESVRM